MADGVRLGGAFYELTADDAKLIQTLARTQSQAKSFSDAIAKSMGSAATSTDASMKKMAASTKQAEAGFGNLSKRALEFSVAVVGIGGAAEIARRGIESIVESTQKAAQAQFALSKTYGTTTPQMVAFAKQFSDQIGRSNTEVQQAAVIVGNLTREYGLSQAQVKELIRISADLAAVYGTDLAGATKRLQDASRGEAEAAESLSLVLNDQAVATRQLGVDGEKLWAKLSDGEKASLRLAEAMRQLGERQGAAQERAEGSLGAFDRLSKATDELGAALGTRLLPVASAVADVLATMATGAVQALDAMNDLSNLDLGKLTQIAAALFAPAGVVANRIIGNTPPQDALLPGHTGRGRDTGRVFGPTLADAEAAAKTAADVAAIKEKARRLLELEAVDKANKATAESAIKAIDQERKAKEQWYDEEKQRIEARRTYQLEDIETRKDAAIKALEEEKRVAKEALETQIEEQERLKKVRLDAADQAAEQAKKAIDAEKDRLSGVREAEDRDRTDARRREDQNQEGIRRTQDRQIEDARKREDAAADDAQKAELSRLEKIRDARVAVIEDDIKRTEAASQRKLRALDREADKAKAASDKALHNLELRGEKEDEQHRKVMQGLEDEQDARLGILDAQLKALDAGEKAADAADRAAGIQKRIADAQKAATTARGTGTPAEIAAARGDLTTALRVGDEISIANARERLVKLAGKSNEEIQKADENLAAAQQDLAKESVDTARDAERDKLKAAQDAIKTEIDGRKRAADDEDRQRKLSLEREQEAEQAKLKSRLDRLEKQKQAAQDNAKTEIDRLRGDVDTAKQASQEQIEITRQRFEAAKGELAQQRVEEDRRREDFRREEDRVRDEERTAQDRFRQDERAEQDKALATQLAAVASTLQLERDETEAHFNGANGTITQLKKAIEDSELLYSRRLAAAQASFEAERKAAELLYTNPEGNGQLQLLEKQRQGEIQALADRKTEYEDQAKAFHDMIAAMIEDLNKLGAAATANQGIPRIGGGPGSAGADSRAAGSGKATSASAATTASGKSGKQVQGTLGTWLNDAMDIAGVGDDWAAGLFELARLESSGDPHNRNDSGASGLMQMMPDTFKGYRDKNLPDDIFDPVANAVASIRYIQQEYLTGHKTGFPADINWIVQNHARRGGYDIGGLFRNPTLTFDTRTGARSILAERGPEYLIGRRQTASMLGPGPRTDYAAMGAFMSSAHPGGSSSSVVEGDVIFNGLTYEQAEVRQRREQRRRSLLTGIGRVRR